LNHLYNQNQNNTFLCCCGTVNHSKNFKNPTNGVCTNEVEGYWATLKRYLRRKQVMQSILLPEHNDEFLWRKVYVKKAGNASDVLLTHIAERYPG